MEKDYNVMNITGISAYAQQSIKQSNHKDDQINGLKVQGNNYDVRLFHLDADGDTKNDAPSDEEMNARFGAAYSLEIGGRFRTMNR